MPHTLASQGNTGLLDNHYAGIAALIISFQNIHCID